MLGARDIIVDNKSYFHEMFIIVMEDRKMKQKAKK